MAYFLGRDVDLYITTESVTAPSGGAAVSVDVGTDGAQLTTTASATSGSMIPQMTLAVAPSGAINDVTGVDLSISVSDEDVGPFLGKPQIMQKVELRKETVVSITRKKLNNFWDVIFNGPVDSDDFIGDSTNAKRMGARFGLQFSATDTAKIAAGDTFMYDVGDLYAATNCCYGYRLHIVLKPFSAVSGVAEEVFVVKNAAMTGHTVSLNADGVTEETIEFTSSVAPSPFVPTAALPSDAWTDVSVTTIAEL